MKCEYLVRLKNYLLFSTLSCKDISDVLEDAKAYLDLAESNDKSYEEILHSLGTPKEFAELIKDASTHNSKNYRFLIYCLYIVFSLMLIMFLLRYHLSVIPVGTIIVLVGIWILSGSSYLLRVNPCINSNRTRFLIVQIVSLLVVGVAILLTNAGINYYIEYLGKQQMLYAAADTVWVWIVFFILLAFFLGCYSTYYFLKGEILFFGLLAQNIGFLISIISFADYFNRISDVNYIFFFPKTYFTCLIFAIISYIAIWGRNRYIYGRTT